MRGYRRPRRGAAPEADPVAEPTIEQTVEPAIEQTIERASQPAAPVAEQPIAEQTAQAAPGQTVEHGERRERTRTTRQASRPRQAKAAATPPSGDNPEAPDAAPSQLSLGVDEAEEILVSVPLEPDTDEGGAGDLAAPSAAEPVPPDDSRFVETDLYAEPEPYAPPAASSVDDPSIRLRLARIHLRTGSLALARAEFESLSATDQLDLTGQLDLAETRWRTGDVHGAGDAALAYVAAGGAEPLGFVIAAEGQAVAGKTAESKGYLEQALDRSVNGVESLFAGIRPRADWPKTQTAVREPVATIEPTTVPADALVPRSAPAVEVPSMEVAAVVEPPAAQPVEQIPVEPAATVGPVEPAAVEPAATVGPVEPAAVEPPEPVESAPSAEPAAPSAPEPEPEPVAASPSLEPWRAEIAAGVDALAANDPLMAALHLAMAVRMSPAAAKPALEAIGGRDDLALELVRTEALRALGPDAQVGPLAAAEPPPSAEIEPERQPELEVAPARPADEPPRINWGD